MVATRKASPSAETPTKKHKSAESISVGDSIPNVEVTLHTGANINLSKEYGDKILAIYSFPKSNTPGCTKQTSGFGAIYPELSESGVTVLGLSADAPKLQTSFKNRTEVNFDFISDVDHELIGPLGATKETGGVVRSHWLFVNGKAVLVEHSVNASQSPGIVLKAVQEYTANGSAEDADAGKTTENASDAKDETIAATGAAVDDAPVDDAAAADPRDNDPDVKLAGEKLEEDEEEEEEEVDLEEDAEEESSADESEEEEIESFGDDEEEDDGDAGVEDEDEDEDEE